MSRRPLEELLNDSELQDNTRCQHHFGYSVSNTLPLWAGAPCRSPSCPLMEHLAGFAPPPCLWPMIKSSFFFVCVKQKAVKSAFHCSPSARRSRPSVYRTVCFWNSLSAGGPVVELVRRFVVCVCLQPRARDCFFPPALRVCTPRALPRGLRMSAGQEVGRNSV